MFALGTRIIIHASGIFCFTLAFHAIYLVDVAAASLGASILFVLSEKAQ